MTAKTFRAAALALTLCVVAQATANEPARATEQDTTNGVAPVKPGPAPEAAPAPAGAATPAPAEPGPEAGKDHVAAAPSAAEVTAGIPSKPVPPPPPPPPTGTEAQRYCDNIAAVAAEARFAWQTRKLTELQAQVSARITELEKKQAELESSLARREEAMKKAQTTLIAVYAKMDPEAAAGQLSLMDDQLAAAVLVQLTPKQSSAILNEIKSDRASQLVSAMTNLPAPDPKADGTKTDGKKS